MGLVGKGLAKRPGRTAMMTTAVAVAVALLVALQSLAAGFLAAQTGEIRDRSVDVLLQPLATRGDPAETGLSAAGVEDAHRVAAEVAALEGVARASPALEAVVVAKPGEEGEATAVLAQGVVPADHAAGLSEAQRAKFDGWFTTPTDDRHADGRYDGPASSEVVVNEALATQRNVTKGGTLWLAASATEPARPFRVAGVFESPFAGGGLLGGTQVALLKLSELQELTHVASRDAASRVAVTLDDATREDEAATRRVLDALESAYPGFQVVTKEQELRDARERAAVTAGFYAAVAYVSLVVSALFVASVMVMEVQQRRRDLGVLRAMGWSRASLFRDVAAEALAFVSLGTLAGVGLGWVASEALSAYFRRGYGLDVDFTSFTPGLVALSVLQSLVIGVAAALYPAWKASRVDALHVIRTAR